MTYPVSDLNSSFLYRYSTVINASKQNENLIVQRHSCILYLFQTTDGSIDLAGPLPCSDKGNKYIIVVTDYFTKWPEACASPTKEAIYVANFLFDLFLRHGCPDITILDQGKEFCNQVWMCQHDCICCIP